MKRYSLLFLQALIFCCFNLLDGAATPIDEDRCGSPTFNPDFSPKNSPRFSENGLAFCDTPSPASSPDSLSGSVYDFPCRRGRGMENAQAGDDRTYLVGPLVNEAKIISDAQEIIAAQGAGSMPRLPRSYSSGNIGHNLPPLCGPDKKHRMPRSRSAGRIAKRSVSVSEKFGGADSVEVEPRHVIAAWHEDETSLGNSTRPAVASMEEALNAPSAAFSVDDGNEIFNVFGNNKIAPSHSVAPVEDFGYLAKIISGLSNAELSDTLFVFDLFGVISTFKSACFHAKNVDKFKEQFEFCRHIKDGCEGAFWRCGDICAKNFFSGKDKANDFLSKISIIADYELSLINEASIQSIMHQLNERDGKILITAECRRHGNNVIIDSLADYRLTQMRRLGVSINADFFAGALAENEFNPFDGKHPDSLYKNSVLFCATRNICDNIEALIYLTGWKPKQIIWMSDDLNLLNFAMEKLGPCCDLFNGLFYTGILNLNPKYDSELVNFQINYFINTLKIGLEALLSDENSELNRRGSRLYCEPKRHGGVNFDGDYRELFREIFKWSRLNKIALWLSDEDCRHNESYLRMIRKSECCHCSVC